MHKISHSILCSCSKNTMGKLSDINFPDFAPSGIFLCFYVL